MRATSTTKGMKVMYMRQRVEIEPKARPADTQAIEEKETQREKTDSSKEIFPLPSPLK